MNESGSTLAFDLEDNDLGGMVERSRVRGGVDGRRWHESGDVRGNRNDLLDGEIAADAQRLEFTHEGQPAVEEGVVDDY